jgi:hypothetical protein
MVNKRAARKRNSVEAEDRSENAFAAPRQSASSASAPPSKKPRRYSIAGCVLLAVALTFAIYVRFRLREFPFERDEGEFAYAGQLLLQGVPPYKLAYNMKLPGTYIAYAALMAVFGQTTAGVHLGLLAVNIATIVLLFRFVRELFDPFSAGMAAVVYAILSVSRDFLGMAAHATHFVGFFGLCGAYMMWRHLQSGRWWPASASGLLMGVAFLMKQQGVFLMVFGGGILLLHGLLLKSYPRRKLPAAVGLYSLAAVLPYGLVCLWLWRAGVWQTFWFWTVEYGSKYVQVVPISQAWGYFWMSASGILSSNWPLLLLALAGLAVLGRNKPGARSFAWGWLVFSFLCTCPGFYFRSHYFIVMLPAVALFAGLGCRLLWDLASGRIWAPQTAVSPADERTLPPSGRRKRTEIKSDAQPAPAGDFGPLSALVVLLLLAAVGWTLYVQRDFFFNWGPLDACRRTYMSNPFLECPEIAKYLKDHTEPDDTIAVIGSEPEVFFDAQRNSATGYIYTYGLMEPQEFAKQMQGDMISEIEAKRPKYIVFANIRCSWLPQSNSETKILRWSDEYLAKNYEPVGIIEPRSRMDTRYLWDDRVGQYQRPKQPPTPESDRFSFELDFYWKLTWFKDNPDTHDYWRKPYITVLKRKP